MEASLTGAADYFGLPVEVLCILYQCGRGEVSCSTLMSVSVAFVLQVECGARARGGTQIKYSAKHVWLAWLLMITKTFSDIVGLGVSTGFVP